MIEPEVATAARSLLSNVIISLVEDEHPIIVSIPADDQLHAANLRQLGADIATLTAAMAAILRRAGEPAS